MFLHGHWGLLQPPTVTDRHTHDLLVRLDIMMRTLQTGGFGGMEYGVMEEWSMGLWSMEFWSMDE